MVEQAPGQQQQQQLGNENGEPTYYVVGPADSMDYAKMEYLGELIMHNLADVSCTFHRSHPAEWPEYAKRVCAKFGFAKYADGHSPFAYTGAGYLVGGLVEFNDDVRAHASAGPVARARAARALTRLARRARRPQCKRKYDMNFESAYTAEQWQKITDANAAESERKRQLAIQHASGKREQPPPPKPGKGAQAGEAVVADLLLSALKVSRGEVRDLADEPLGAYDAPDVTFVVSDDLPFALAKRFGLPDSYLYTVESPGGALTADALQGVAYGAAQLRTPAVVLLADVDSEYFDTCARARPLACARTRADAPVPAAHAPRPSASPSPAGRSRWPRRGPRARTTRCWRPRRCGRSRWRRPRHAWSPSARRAPRTPRCDPRALRSGSAHASRSCVTWCQLSPRSCGTARCTRRARSSRAARYGASDRGRRRAAPSLALYQYVAARRATLPC